jgi:hypothetical protein
VTHWRVGSSRGQWIAFDRDDVDYGEDGILNRLCAVGMRRDLPSEFVSFLGDSTEFFHCVLRCARLVALGQYRTGRREGGRSVGPLVGRRR